MIGNDLQPTSTGYNLVIGGTISSGSDYRIKENIQILNINEYNIDKLNPLFYFNKNSQNNEFGFLAHEVQDIFPFLVRGKKDDDEIQTLNYSGLIGLLTKEIQELKKEMKELKNKMNI